MRGELQKRQWVIFDGDVDPEWVENLNSVLDDNKLLTLPNGERLSLPPNVSTCSVVAHPIPSHPNCRPSARAARPWRRFWGRGGGGWGEQLVVQIPQSACTLGYSRPELVRRSHRSYKELPTL